MDAALGRVARPRSAPGAVPVPRGCLAMSRPPDGSQPWSRSSWAASLGGSGASLPLAAPGGSPLPPLCAPSPWGCVCVWFHVLTRSPVIGLGTRPVHCGFMLANYTGRDCLYESGHVLRVQGPRRRFPRAPSSFLF